MQKKYTLPSGAELMLDHSVTNPTKNVFIISTEFTLNGDYFGAMKAYYGTKYGLRNAQYCHEIKEALKCVDKSYYSDNEPVTVITDFRIDRFFVSEKKTCYIFHNLFRYLHDIGCNSLVDVYANKELVDMQDEEAEIIHRKLMLGLDSYVAF